MDSEACCRDFEDKSLSAVAFATVGSLPGIYETSYSCTDGFIGTVVVAKRQVIVNSLPVIQLLGNSVEKVTKGTGYADAGVVCQDAEDGLITNLIPDVDNNECLDVMRNRERMDEHAACFMLFSFKERVEVPRP